MILDGKTLARKTLDDLTVRVVQFRAEHQRVPSLAVILVGNDPASEIYVRKKAKTTTDIGMRSEQICLPETISQDDLLKAIRDLNRAEWCDGILVQLPLPSHIDPKRVIQAIAPLKDVDGFHPHNIGRLVQRDPAIIPCTPLGCLKLIREHRPNLRGSGLHAVMVGASNIVGRPMGQLLLLEGCTVTQTHRFTPNTPELARQADILVAAAGKPHLVKADWIKPGATVIDVGINRIDGRIVGDVDFETAKDVAGAITPVPGGVGPMTIAMLLQNTFEAAERLAGPEGDGQRLMSVLGKPYGGGSDNHGS